MALSCFAVPIRNPLLQIRLNLENRRYVTLVAPEGNQIIPRAVYSAIAKNTVSCARFKIFDNLNSAGNVLACDGKVVNRFSEFVSLPHFGSHDWVWAPCK